MNGDLHELYAERVRYLGGLLRGIENLADVAAVVSSAESESAAIERLSSVLGLDADQCRPIIDMRLGQLLPDAASASEQQLRLPVAGS